MIKHPRTFRQSIVNSEISKSQKGGKNSGLMFPPKIGSPQGGNSSFKMGCKRVEKVEKVVPKGVHISTIHCPSHCPAGKFCNAWSLFATTFWSVKIVQILLSPPNRATLGRKIGPLSKAILEPLFEVSKLFKSPPNRAIFLGGKIGPNFATLIISVFTVCLKHCLGN